MIEGTSFPLTYSSKSFPHTLRAFLLSSLVLLSYLSSYLPYSNVQTSKEVLSSAVTPPFKDADTQEDTFFPLQLQELLIEYKKVEPTKIPKRSQATKDAAFGVATQIGEHTWTMRVNEDAKVGTSAEIFSALNVYRQRHGRSKLSWDDGLGSFAQSRADSFISLGKADAHAGFSDYINNQEGFKKLGFYALGENSSFGYKLEAVHLIEWVYAGDAPHNNNQLSSDWSHVGIGVAGVATDLVFGGRKI